MSASLTLWVPIAALIVISPLCFVGCTLPTEGLPPAPFTDYTTADILPHPALVAYWPLDELPGASTAIDVKGTAVGMPHNGTYTSVDTAPSLFPCPAFTVPQAPDADIHSAAAPGTLTLGTQGLVPGDTVQPINNPAAITTAMQVDGGFVLVEANPDTNPAKSFTIEAWVRPEWVSFAPPATRVFIDSRSVIGGSTNGFGLWVNEENRWEAAVGVGGPKFVVVTAGPAKLAEATHVVLTFDGTGISLFTDGKRDSPATPLPDGSSFSPNTTAPLVIGVGLPWLPPRTMPTDEIFFPCLPFRGKIQDVAIYNGVLTDAEIATHHRDGNGGNSG